MSSEIARLGRLLNALLHATNPSRGYHIIGSFVDKLQARPKRERLQTQYDFRELASTSYYLLVDKIYFDGARYGFEVHNNCS
jgi:hypothetical protein